MSSYAGQWLDELLSLIRDDTCMIHSLQCEPFKKLVDEYAPRMGLDGNKVVLLGPDRHYDLDKTPESEGLSVENVVEMDLLEVADSDEDGAIKLKVQVKGKRPFTVKFAPVMMELLT